MKKRFFGPVFLFIIAIFWWSFDLPLDILRDQSISSLSSIESGVVGTIYHAISATSTPALVSVGRVIDGDTFTISEIGQNERKVRLIGVDTPEVVDPRKTVQCFGREASAFTKSLLAGQSVRLETDPSQGRYDKYGRLLAYAYLPSGELINELLIRQGYAHEYTYRTPYRWRTLFRQAEMEARREDRGLWASTTCAGLP